MEKIYSIGSILGDVIGSKFENNTSNSDIQIDIDSDLSDDSVLTFASMDYLLNHKKDKFKYAHYLKKWYKKYPDKNYGNFFKQWAISDSLKPYGSKGNGCLMRILPVEYYFKSLFFIKYYAKKMCKATHNNPESIKATKAFVEAMYYLKNGMKKSSVKQKIFKKYKFPIPEDSIKDYQYSQNAKETIIISFAIFFKYDSIDEMIKTIISLNGDCDTILAVTLSLCEFAYEFNEKIINNLFKFVLSKYQEMIDLLLIFNESIKKRGCVNVKM